MEDQFNNPLKRYTSLSVALDMITNQRLTLLSPGTWDDKNDIASLDPFVRNEKWKRSLPVVLRRHLKLFITGVFLDRASKGFG